MMDGKKRKALEAVGFRFGDAADFLELTEEERMFVELRVMLAQAIRRRREQSNLSQRLNVASFLVSGIGQRDPEVIGEPYADADGTEYLPMFRQPVLIFEGSKEILTKAHERAISRGVAVSVFTADLFATGNDRDNRAAVRAVRTADLDLVGMAAYGPRAAVDKIVKGARMHP